MPDVWYVCAERRDTQVRRPHRRQRGVLRCAGVAGIRPNVMIWSLAFGAMAGEPDFASEGLLDGVEGPARAAREQLLRELLEEGCTVGELRRAVEEDRLALLPSERLLQRDKRFIERYTPEEVAQLAGVDAVEL